VGRVPSCRRGAARPRLRLRLKARARARGRTSRALTQNGAVVRVGIVATRERRQRGAGRGHECDSVRYHRALDRPRRRINDRVWMAPPALQGQPTSMPTPMLMLMLMLMRSTRFAASRRTWVRCGGQA